MRTKEQMEARVAELDAHVEALFRLMQATLQDRMFLVETSNKLCIERDAIKWCLDETLYPYPKEK
jgi:hypothetical protein